MAINPNDPGWLVKDFDVLYRAAERVSEACHGRGDEGPYGPLNDLDAQLRRLAPAHREIQALKASAMPTVANLVDRAAGKGD